MATATIIDRPMDLAEWLSHETIEFQESLDDEINCRIEAFAGHLTTRLKEAALRVARDGVNAKLADLRGAAPTDAETPGQNVLPLQPRTPAATPGGTPPASSPRPARAPRGEGASRAPREGSIASEVVAFLTADPDKAFTVTAITNGLGTQRSSGAVDATCKRMASRGELTQVGAAPRTYKVPAESR